MSTLGSITVVGSRARERASAALGVLALAAAAVVGMAAPAQAQEPSGDITSYVLFGSVYTYALDSAGDDLVVPFDQTWVLDSLPVNPQAGGVQPASGHGQRLLTLTTCASLFHTEDRLVAFGHLVSTAAR